MTDPPPPDSPLILQGQLLLAAPSLPDGVFHRSVVLLAAHSPADGAFGLVLNHPTGRIIGDLLTDEAFTALRDVPVHHGGPVDVEQLTFTAMWADAGGSLHWETRISADHAIEKINQPDTLVHAFVGHSGWSPGQLEGELCGASWIPARPRPNLVHLQHDLSLWGTLLRQLSPYHQVLAEAPSDPLQN
jgi:putative transcriptional regulator